MYVLSLYTFLANKSVNYLKDMVESFFLTVGIVRSCLFFSLLKGFKAEVLGVSCDGVTASC